MAGHLAGCFDALYRSLGHDAPLFTEDAHVIVAYELGRTFGACRHDFVALVAHRAGASASDVRVEIPEIASALETARDLDPTGTFSLHVLATLIAPRLLISLRDASESSSPVGEGPLAATARRCAGEVIAATHRIGSGAHARVPLDAALWRDAAVAISEQFSQAGYGESFGLGSAG